MATVDQIAFAIGETPCECFGNGGTLRGILEAYIEPEYPTKAESAAAVAGASDILRRAAERALQNMEG